MSQIQAPYTEEQIKNLYQYQFHGLFHPFTCINDHRRHKEKRLVPFKNGMICPTCGFIQTWCHEGMADGSMDNAMRKMLKLAYETK